MTRCIVHKDRRRALEAQRIQRENEEREAAMPLLFRISARLEVWVLIITAEAAALAFVGGMFR